MYTVTTITIEVLQRVILFYASVNFQMVQGNTGHIFSVGRAKLKLKENINSNENEDETIDKKSYV